MGRGNCCVFGKYEGLFYVDNDDLWIYHHKDNTDETKLLKDVPYGELDTIWQYDEIESDLTYQEFIDQFTDDMIARFPSFESCDEWMKSKRDLHIRLKNKLFYVCTEDNEWSIAVELIQIDDDRLAGLQAGLYQKYLDGIRDCLFNQFQSLGTYGCAWTSGTIYREPKEGEGG